MPERSARGECQKELLEGSAKGDVCGSSRTTSAASREEEEGEEEE